MDIPKKLKHGLFSVVGIEIEYMVVNQTTLDIQPIVDTVFEKIAGEMTNEIERDTVALNNELALHVIELKTNGPTDNPWQAQLDFQNELKHLTLLLAEKNCKLMPTGMHPWMNPANGVKLWPHGDKTIYEMYHKIFDCRGHGWSNLQSVHVNLPFGNENEFIKLHNAIRLLLPLTPSLFASTPICENKSTGSLSTRLTYYANNQKKIPEITGDVIPEYIQGYSDYYDVILNPMFDAIAPYDPEKILQEEWLNSRGAITRFDRDAIEIRVVDSQECALADFACASAITGILKYIVTNTDAYLQNPLDNQLLKQIFFQTVQEGMASELNQKTWIEQFDLPKNQYASARHLWEDLLAQSTNHIPAPFHSTLEYILTHGNLAERILKSLPKVFKHQDLYQLYTKLCQCLQENQLLKI